MLAAKFSGRWDDQNPRDSRGYFFIDYPQSVFEPLVDYLREKRLETPDMPAKWPPDVPERKRGMFEKMVDYFGVRPTTRFARFGGHCELSNDSRTVKCRGGSGGSVVGGAMPWHSGTHVLVVRFDVVPSDYVSLGLVHPSNNLKVGPGFVGKELAWCTRGGGHVCSAGLFIDKYRVQGDVPSIASGDIVRLVFDTDRRHMACTNVTSGNAFTIEAIPDIGPMCFGVGGSDGAEATLQ